MTPLTVGMWHEMQPVAGLTGQIVACGASVNALPPLKWCSFWANRAVHCFKMPSLAKSPPTCDAFRRSASAMLVTPMVRSKPIVAFRKAAITSGPERLRIRLASSPIVTSRT